MIGDAPSVCEMLFSDDIRLIYKFDSKL